MFSLRGTSSTLYTIQIHVTLQRVSLSRNTLKFKFFRYLSATNTVRSESRCALLKRVGSLEVMSTSVYTGLSPFNFIRKHFLQICF